MAPFRGRTEANDIESARRMEAAVAWLRETFAEARASDASAVVIAFHGDPRFEDLEDRGRAVFEPFIEALEEEAERFQLPVLAIHGDWHDYTVDHPLISRTTGLQLDNVTRLQVPGSPDVGWVRVTVTPGAAEPFAFEPRVVPHWKYW